jgi:2-dehydropantoate 2-reductase
MKPSQYSVIEKTSDGDKQDIVFLTAKADNLLDISYQIPPLLKENTIVISATNGIPPWYSYLQNETIGRFSFNTKPRQIFINNVGAERIIGAVIERSVQRLGSCQILHSFGSGYRLGELDHKSSERLLFLQDILQKAHLSAIISNDIHRDIWLKLIGNVCLSPTSVIEEKI